MITTGPEIKCAILLRDGKAVRLEAGQTLEITTDKDIEGDEMRISCSYKSLPESVGIGSSILIDDGKIALEVTEIFENAVRTIVKNDGIVRENRPMHLPNAMIDIPTIKQQD